MFCQDAHYWTNQYGTRGQLLGGVVVGSIEDLSAAFYNPGALALITEPGLILGADAFEFITVNHQNGAGEGINLRSFRAAKAPNMFAFQFGGPKNRKHHWAFSILTRYDTEVRVNALRITSREQLENNQSDVAFANGVEFNQGLKEIWGGVPSWGYEPADGIGVGATQYVAVRTQRGRVQALGQSLNIVDGEGANVNILDNYNYYNVRLLWKLGISFDLTPLTFGVALTTPGINLFGSGHSLSNTFLNNVDTSGDGVPDPQLNSNFQEGLDARIKSPLSIAAGASYRLGHTTFHTSVEWFQNLDPYAVMTPEPYRSQSSGETVAPQLTHSLRSVTNWGFSVQQIIHERLAFYAAFTSDFSALDDSSNTNLSTATWNIWHVLLGSEFGIKTIRATFGIGYSFGKEKAESLVDLHSDIENVDVNSLFRENKITFRRWRVLFGVSVPF